VQVVVTGNDGSNAFVTIVPSGMLGTTDWCRLSAPTSISSLAGAPADMHGIFYEAGPSEASGAPGGVLGQFGLGPQGSVPSSAWQWTAASWLNQLGTDDKYSGQVVPPASGLFSYAFRVSLDQGGSWTYCDVDVVGVANLGTLTAD
jgi:hypothetical protein